MSGTITTTAAGYFSAMRDAFNRVDLTKIEQYADLVFKAWQEDRRIYLFGNGGSAYTASHHCTDYVKTAMVAGQKRLQAYSLADNTGLLTALGNDISYDDVFSFQLESYAKPGDIAVAISCSGNSPNVVKAANWARANGLTVVAITGTSGGKVGPIAHLHININHDNFGVIEDVQMSVGHIVAQALHHRVSQLVAGKPPVTAGARA